VLAHGNPIFGRSKGTSKHVLHASTQAEHCSPPIMLQLNRYGASNDGMLGAGKL
jgi:UDP-glucose 4-epimerase